MVRVGDQHPLHFHSRALAGNCLRLSSGRHPPIIRRRPTRGQHVFQHAATSTAKRLSRDQQRCGNYQ